MTATKQPSMPAAWQELDYYGAQRFKCVGEVEEAWAKDARETNYRLKDGDKVVLRHATIADGGAELHSTCVPAGAEGVVTRARTPRVTRRRGQGSLYFANVKVVAPNGVTLAVRVPHSALRKA